MPTPTCAHPELLTSRPHPPPPFPANQRPLQQWQYSAIPLKAGLKSVCPPSSGTKPNTVGNLPGGGVTPQKKTSTLFSTLFEVSRLLNPLIVFPYGPCVHTRSSPPRPCSVFVGVCLETDWEPFWPRHWTHPGCRWSPACSRGSAQKRFGAAAKP